LSDNNGVIFAQQDISAFGVATLLMILDNSRASDNGVCVWITRRMPKRPFIAGNAYDRAYPDPWVNKN
jgi:hypothetical protein